VAWPFADCGLATNTKALPGHRTPKRPIGLEDLSTTRLVSYHHFKVNIMAANAKEFYAKTVRTLSPKERLRLAALILNDLTNSNEQIDFSDAWTEKDVQDLTTFALSHSENPHEHKKKKHSRSR